MRTHAFLALAPLAAIAIAMSSPAARAQARAARATRARRRLPLRKGRTSHEESEQRLYEITLPALSLETEFATVRRRLLADFPCVVEVLAMRTPGTVLIAYRGEDEVDAWCQALSDAVALQRESHGPPNQPRPRGPLQRHHAGAAAAWGSGQDLKSAA